MFLNLGRNQSICKLHGLKLELNIGFSYFKHVLLEYSLLLIVIFIFAKNAGLSDLELFNACINCGLELEVVIRKVNYV